MVSMHLKILSKVLARLRLTKKASPKNCVPCAPAQGVKYLVATTDFTMYHDT